MYLKSIHLENTGPITKFDLELPFENELPKPVVLVGRNGSGKSTVLSFIVNALVGLKQQVFDDVEIEKGKVYRIRSPLGIRGGANFFHADIRFENDVRLFEWQTDRPREVFKNQLGWEPQNPTWSEINGHDSTHYSLTFGSLDSSKKIEQVLNLNSYLFFPADRFEPPDWLNTDDLSSELKLPIPPKIKGQTARRIFSRNRLKPTMEWLTSLILDVLLYDHRDESVYIPTADEYNRVASRARVPIPGASTATLNAITTVLKEILTEESSDIVQISLGDRRSRILSASVMRNGVRHRIIPDLLSLSAGESALFCMFAGIILDADLAGIPFGNTTELPGIVLIDEADLHLHLALQHRALPRLLRLFPKIQFILSVHSPLVVLGMESEFGSSGFLTLEMPSGTPINAESYSEFLNAFDIFKSTRSFEAQLLDKVNSQQKPVLLLEGASDVLHLQTAWEKLKPGIPFPYEPIPCGIEPAPESRSGGAEMLRRCLEFLSIASDRPVVAVFDNDRSGNEQFNGLNLKAFEKGHDCFHRKHRTKSTHAILLPVPISRSVFVTADDFSQRYLSIEHYFSDKLLKDNGMMGSYILGTVVFEIKGKKVDFAKKLKDHSGDEFTNFNALFEKLESTLSPRTSSFSDSN